MFQIGEFSRIARVSTAQLRHYDKIGLFQPTHTDDTTGYRYYSATQLPQLNRILALKDLGMSLEQIARLLENDVSAAEIHGMLTLKKAQVEQTLRDELTRMRSIEERLWEIETEGVLSDEDVVLKAMPEQKFLSTRRVVPTVADGFRLMYEIQRLLPQRAGRSIVGNFGLIFHADDFAMENVDVEMGFLLEQDFFDTLPLPDGDVIRVRSVPAVETMATLVRVGIHNNSVGHYGALGTWIERHDFQLAGPGWEVFIQPFVPGKEDEAVIEIRLPVKPTHSIKEQSE
jgi:DNA-binding transcriptional MerR regulator